MRTLFWLAVPDQALPILVVVSIVMILFGFGRAGVGLLITTLLMPILSPIVETLMSELPPWVSLVVLIVIALAVLRGILSVLIGKGAADHAIGTLAADVIRITVIALLFLPIRVVRAAVGMLGGSLNGNGGRMET